MDYCVSLLNDLSTSSLISFLIFSNISNLFKFRLHYFCVPRASSGSLSSQNKKQIPQMFAMSSPHNLSDHFFYIFLYLYLELPLVYLKTTICSSFNTISIFSSRGLWVCYSVCLATGSSLPSSLLLQLKGLF